MSTSDTSAEFTQLVSAIAAYGSACSQCATARGRRQPSPPEPSMMPILQAAIELANKHADHAVAQAAQAAI